MSGMPAILLVSVIIPTYNRAAFIGRSVGSVLAVLLKRRGR